MESMAKVPLCVLLVGVRAFHFVVGLDPLEQVRVLLQRCTELLHSYNHMEFGTKTEYNSISDCVLQHA